jgi:hypothetical protein
MLFFFYFYVTVLQFMRHNTVMKNPDASLTLDELSTEVGRLLEEKALLEAQADGRGARAAPDARTVRYYGTLGLVDRPSIVDREARYGRRHVLQLVADQGAPGRGAAPGGDPGPAVRAQ